MDHEIGSGGVGLRKHLGAILLAVLCTFITLGGATLAVRVLPYSKARDAITDLISIPGGLIAAILGFGGPHDSGGDNWATAAMLSNWIFYFGFWLTLILAWKAWKRRSV